MMHIERLDQTASKGECPESIGHVGNESAIRPRSQLFAEQLTATYFGWHRRGSKRIAGSAADSDFPATDTLQTALSDKTIAVRCGRNAFVKDGFKRRVTGRALNIQLDLLIFVFGSLKPTSAKPLVDT